MNRGFSRHAVLIVAALVVANHGTHAAASPVSASLHASVTADSDGNPSQVSGSIRYDGLAQNTKHCFYVAYEDPDYGQDWVFNRRFDISVQKLSPVAFRGGQSTITSTASRVISRDTAVIEVESGASHLELQFRSSVPRLPETKNNEWFYDGFYPQLMSRCPSEDEDGATVPLESDVWFSSTLEGPADWVVVAPGSKTTSGRYALHGKSYVFALAQKIRVEHRKVGGMDVDYYFYSDSFSDIHPTIETAITTLTHWLGDFPQQHLTIVESSDLQRSSIPGMLVFNSPKQSAFRNIEKFWLNWRHWVAVNLVASQWLGAYVGVNDRSDNWLLDGLADFLTERVVSASGIRSNFFNSYESAIVPLRLNYLQMQEVTAALLRRYAPKTTLVTPGGLESVPLANQHALAFIRQVFAMRQLYFDLGETSEKRFLHRFVEQFSWRTVDPESFVQFAFSGASEIPLSKRPNLKRMLVKWWSESDWPDYRIESFSSERVSDAHWLASIDIRAASDFSVPGVVIEVEDAAGRSYSSRTLESQFADGVAHVVVSTAEKPERATIDPHHEFFDENRFDNGSDPPTLKFFPGNADSLDDSNYTLFWLPYPFRRPGESTSIGIVAALFHYLQSSFYLKVEEELATRRAGGYARYTQNWSTYNLHGQAYISQTYEGFRLGELALDRNTGIAGLQHLSLGLRARHRETVGVENTAHKTGALAGDVGVPFAKWFSLTMAGEEEVAPAQLADGFSYIRNKASLTLRLSPGAGTDLYSRFFSGHLSSTGTVPDLALFGPEDLGEAQLRLDVPNLDRVQSIETATNEFSFPLVIPFPGDSLILSRNIKGRVFYDLGYSADQGLSYRDAGIGTFIPFGGDLAGVGSFALTQFSVSAVLYSDVGGDVSKKPRILFDLLGDL